MVTLQNPISIPSPEIPFDIVKINIAATTVVLDDDSIDMAISVVLKPARIVDGKLQESPVAAHTKRYSQGAALTQGPAAIQALAAQIETLVQNFVNAQGF